MTAKYFKKKKSVRNKPGILKVEIFSVESGKKIGATKYRATRVFMTNTGKVQKEKEFFDIDSAFQWKHDPNAMPEESVKMKFSDWAIKYIEEKKHHHELTTTIRYNNLIEKSFKDSSLWMLPVEKITAKEIRKWLVSQINKVTGKKRRNFDHELELLRAILNLWGEIEGIQPVKISKELFKLGEIQKPLNKNRKKITEDDLNRILEVLENKKDNQIMVPLTATMFYCALRIGEALALSDASLNFSLTTPHKSQFKVQVAAKDPREKGSAAYLGDLKNAQREHEMKILPVVPQLYKILMKYEVHKRKGFLFSLDGGVSFLKYRWVQYRLAKVLTELGLNMDFTSTHFARHGGATWAYHLSGSKAIAGQMLGDKSPQIIERYIAERPDLILSFSESLWAQVPDSKVTPSE